ncbi:MAG TPA: hypothetical protein VHG72_21775 [Polyangia bacterium]|nr:hypothetical protein [Polyangia bacterium]
MKPIREFEAGAAAMVSEEISEQALLRGRHETAAVPASKQSAPGVWAIYHAPLGSRQLFMVQFWTAAADRKPQQGGEPLFAASLDEARAMVPVGLTRYSAKDKKAEAPGLIETWEERA